MPGLDDMMAELRSRAGSVRGSFDVGALATAGRRRARRRRAALGGALVAATVMVLGGGVWGLTAWAGHQPDRAVVADATGTAPSAPAAGEIPPVQVSVDTSGWLTFSSPQYPVTFRYPPDWTTGDLDGSPVPLDGCDEIHCVLIVAPPQSSGAAAIELIRYGFEPAGQASVRVPDGQTVLGSVPGLAAWGLDGQGPSPVVVVSSEDEYGAGVNYSLAVAGSAWYQLALGDEDPQPGHPEAVFSFSTNVGNIGGQTDGEYVRTLVAILASVQPNPGFAPTQVVRPPEVDQTAPADPAAPDQAASGELLPDGGFESGDGGWKPFNVGNMTRVTSPVRSGAYAMKVTSPLDYRDLTGLTQNTAVDDSAQGKTYTASCYVYPSAPGLEVRIRLAQYSPDFASHEFLGTTVQRTLPADTWTQVSVTGTATADGQRIIPQIYSTLQTVDTGYLVYDDCSLTVS